jgi:hypothetical protein
MQIEIVKRESCLYGDLHNGDVFFECEEDLRNANVNELCMKTDIYMKDGEKFNAIYLNDGGSCCMSLKDEVYLVKAKVTIEV